MVTLTNAENALKTVYLGAVTSTPKPTLFWVKSNRQA